MATAVVYPRAHHGRGFAHVRERRSPQAGVSSSLLVAATPVTDSTEATSTPEPASTIQLPTDVKALTGIIVVLGVCIIAFVIWRIRCWNRNRVNAASKLIITSNEKHSGFTTHVNFKSATFDMGEPHKPVLKPTPPPPSAGVGWVPQLRADIALPEPTKRSKRAKKAWEQNLAKFMAPTVPEREPPPYYMAPAAPAMPAMQPMSVKFPQQTLPPTPAATLKLSFDGIIPPPSQKSKPSPARTSSYGPHPALAPRLSLSSRKSDRKFPRLMTVAHPFEPSMDDELSIGLGETVRLLEEYEDEWCLVQRVGRIDAMKGVVPRFCLMERTEVIPSHPRHPSAGSYRC